MGEPNCGKSNILEALGVLSAIGHKGEFNEFVRMQTLTNIFHDEFYSKPISIEYDEISLKIKVQEETMIFEPSSDISQNQVVFHFNFITTQEYSLHNITNQIQKNANTTIFNDSVSKIKYFRIPNLGKKYRFHGNRLHPPYGVNLFDVIKQDPDLTISIKDLLDDFGYKLNLDPGLKEIKIAKDQEGLLTSYPLSTAADTIISYITHLVAIHSHQKSTLVFEEPEGHMFPYYVKELAELICEDETNTFFITSHNPYFFDTLVSKCNPEKITVNLVYIESFETKIKQLNQKEIQIIRQGDPFFTINKLLK